MFAVTPGAVCGVALLAHTASAPAVPGYPQSLADLGPPETLSAAAERVAAWADQQTFPIIDPSFSRAPGLWYPPLAAPSDTAAPLPLDMTEVTEIGIFLAGAPPVVVGVAQP